MVRETIEGGPAVVEDAESLYGSGNPFAFMELQDVKQLSNFFERRVSAYQVAVTGSFATDEEF